ncbi:MAG: DNA-3-methyladenine glycosylase [Oligoflexia bacterium]|nr:DNA-3-methyladenine glycosylase [Oligoflexia bacterium]
MSSVNYKKALLHLSKADKKLGKLIKKAGPCDLEIETKVNPYGALMRSIVYQQLHGAAASTIFGRVKALYGSQKLPTPQQILATPDEKLRGAGLSRSKLLAIKDLSTKALEGFVPTRLKASKMSDEDLIKQLSEIRGIGPWTVEMLLIFYLGRLDVLPITDYGVRHGFSILYKKKDLPKPQELLAYGERWRPYRSIAAWYMWRSTDMSKKPKAKVKLK